MDLLNIKEDVGHNAWTLVRHLVTNPVLYNKVLKLDKDPDFSWDTVFDTGSIYKLLYAL